MRWTRSHAGPNGTRALVEILRDHGIDVVVADERAEALTALSEREATLVLPDLPALSDDAVRAVWARPRWTSCWSSLASRTLRLFLPGSSVDGVGFGALVEPGCELAEAQRAGAIAPGALFEAGGADVERVLRNGVGLRACSSATDGAQPHLGRRRAHAVRELGAGRERQRRTRPQPHGAPLRRRLVRARPR